MSVKRIRLGGESRSKARKHEWLRRLEANPNNDDEVKSVVEEMRNTWSTPMCLRKELSLMRTYLRNRLQHRDVPKAMEQLQAVVDLYEFDPSEAALDPSRLIRVFKRDDSGIGAQAARLRCSDEEEPVNMVAAKKEGEPPYPRDWIEFIAGFIAADGKDKNKLQRCYRQSGNRITRPPGVHNILRGVKLLPDAILSYFKITSDEFDVCKRSSNASLLEGQMTGARDFSAERHVATAKEFLQQTGSISKLILGLCALSGRRQTEITNGRSTFAPVDKEPRCLWFDGQLKKNGSCRYKIPILGVTGDEFLKALERLRLRQRHPPGWDLLPLTELNRKVSSRYQPDLHKQCKKCEAWSSHIRRTHDLRGCYAGIVQQWFTFKSKKNPERVLTPTLGMVTMYVLGHKDLQTGMPYTRIQSINRRPEETGYVFWLEDKSADKSTDKVSSS